MFTTYAYFVRGAKHAAMCRTSIESVKRAIARPEQPGSELYAAPRIEKPSFLVVTDEVKPSWSIPDATLVTMKEAGMPMMLANLEAQCMVLAHRGYGEVVTFLDTDVLLVQQLPELPSEADMLITWRDHALVDEGGGKIEGIANLMPYNYGVMQARMGYASLEAFIWMRERIRRMQLGHQQWYGNQLAVFELAGARPEEGSRLDLRSIPWMLTRHGNGVNILKVPCAQYNYTPQKVGERVFGARYALHFKGGSRALMESYAKRLELSWHLEGKKEAA